MKLEHNQLIQGLIELKWMSKEAVPLLSTKMYEHEISVVGKLRAHGLTAEAVFEAAIYANRAALTQIPVVDLKLINPMTGFDCTTFATKEEMTAQYVVPLMVLGERLIVATADPFNNKFFDTLTLRSPQKIDYWLADSDEIISMISRLNQSVKGSLVADTKASIDKMETPAKRKASIAQENVAISKTIPSESPSVSAYTSGRKEPTLSFMNSIEQGSQNPIEVATDLSNIPMASLDTATTETASLYMASVTPIIATPALAADNEEPEAERGANREVDHARVHESSIDDVAMSDDMATSKEDLRFVALQDSALDIDEFEHDTIDVTDAMAHEYVGVDDFQHDYETERDIQHEHIEEGGIAGNAQTIVLSTEKNDVLLREAMADEVEDVPSDQSDRSDQDIASVKENTKENVEENIEERAEGADDKLSAIMLQEVLDAVKAETDAAKSSDIEAIEGDVVEYINFVLLDAITQKASDIHFEPYESSYRIRFRIDGVLYKTYVIPEEYRKTLTSRLKVMAELDIAEKRLPQDGHLTLYIEDEELDARISVIPTLWGEKIVIRLLDNSEMNLSLAKLGLSAIQKGIIQSTIEKPQGLVLVTGPTGAGKTVTLYACLNHLNQPSRNIATVEDPIEINLEGVNQLQVHPKIGLDFAEALRAFLRQDPDVLMVGEVRDYETADITMKAAQTGHLVLSTLHTNNAVESLVRLKNMGIEAYNIASTVKLVIAQRLLRELCHCREEDIVDSDYLETLGFTPMQAASRFYRASGCSECHDGYRGRFAIFEVMPISKRMEALILEGSSAADIAAQAEREGVKTLRQSGIDAVIEGRTSLEEVLRVTVE